jgi:hypothetical protein
MSKPETLRGLIEDSKKEIVARVKQIAVETERATAGNTESPALIAAALGVISELSRAGNVIFSQEIPATGVKQDKPKTLDFPTPIKNHQENDNHKANSFDELLIQRIDIELLKPDAEGVTKNHLYEILKGKNGKQIMGKQMIKSAISDKNAFSREEAIKIVKLALIESNRINASRERYTRPELMQCFGTNASRLDSWGEQTGYNWKANPTMDTKTAMAIRGLAAIDRLLGLTTQRNGKLPTTLQTA